MSHGSPAAKGIIRKRRGLTLRIDDGGEAVQGVIGVNGKPRRVNHGNAVTIEVIGVDGIKVVLLIAES